MHDASSALYSPQLSTRSVGNQSTWKIFYLLSRQSVNAPVAQIKEKLTCEWAREGEVVIVSRDIC